MAGIMAGGNKDNPDSHDNRASRDSPDNRAHKDSHDNLGSRALRASHGTRGNRAGKHRKPLSNLCPMATLSEFPDSLHSPDSVHRVSMAGVTAARAGRDRRATVARAWDKVKDKRQDKGSAGASVPHVRAPISTISNPTAMPTRRLSRPIAWVYRGGRVADSAEVRRARVHSPTGETAAGREAVPEVARATVNFVAKVAAKRVDKGAAMRRAAMARREAKSTAMSRRGKRRTAIAHRGKRRTAISHCVIRWCRATRTIDPRCRKIAMKDGGQRTY